MPYTLNTSHALYANLIELIGVSGSALESLVTSRTFTVDGSASFGSGALGDHLNTVADGYTPHGASFSPELSIDTTANPELTLVVVFNGTADGGSGQQAFLGASTSTGNTPNIGRSSAIPSGRALSRTSTTAQVGTLSIAAANMLTVVRNGETSYEMYVDATFDVGGGRLTYDTGNALYGYLGGMAGHGGVTAEIVWMAWFNKALTPTEVADLYNSLGANNTFGLVEPPVLGGDVTVTEGADVLAATGSVSVEATMALTEGADVFYAAAGGIAGDAIFGEEPDDVLIAGAAGAAGTITTSALKNRAGTVRANTTIPVVLVVDRTDNSVAVLTNQVTDGSGALTITGLSSGRTYAVIPLGAVATPVGGTIGGVRHFIAN